MLVPIASDGNGALAVAKDREGNIVDTFTADADSVSMRMMVLVNNETSGPAELFACDLRDFGKAQIIGVTTAGNGTMQSAFKLSDGGAIVLTVAEITPYVSEGYNGKGITPDYEITLSAEQKAKLPILSQADDPQYQKAYNILIGEDNG